VTAQGAFAPIDGVSLSRYVDIRRALVRTAGRSQAGFESELGRYGLSADRWARIERGWSERIRNDQAVRAIFCDLYARPDRRSPTPAFFE
jgi:hypothetical protein